MKRLVFWQLFVAALLLTSNSHAQSIKDLFNKENIEKAVNAVTGKSTADMTGTWSYTGSAIEFESDNLLQKAGGAVAATAAEKKLDEQLAKVGIKAGHGTSHKHAELVFLLIGLFWLRVYPQIFSGGIRVLAVVGRTG